MVAVLNTRPREQAGALSDALQAAGFHPVEVPLVELVLLADALKLLDNLPPHHYGGLLLSSPNLLPLLKSAGLDVPSAWKSKPWYLISARARAQVDALGAATVFIPAEPSLEGFLQEIPPQPGLNLIHPCSTKTQLDPALFIPKGITVHNRPLYAPRCPEGAAAVLAEAWPRMQAVLFASGSAVHHLFESAPEQARTLTSGATSGTASGTGHGPAAVSIGASTSSALRHHGVETFTQAPTADNAGFVAALQTLFPTGDES